MKNGLKEIVLRLTKRLLPLLQVLTIVFFVICETTWIAPFVLLYQAVQMFKSATLFVDNLKSKMMFFIFGKSDPKEAAPVVHETKTPAPVLAPEILIEEVDSEEEACVPNFGTPGRAVIFDRADTPPEVMTPRSLFG